MLSNLSPYELETPVKLAENGPGGNFDQIAMAKLFVLQLVVVDPNRRLMLTPAGRQYSYLLPTGVQPRPKKK